jgi:glycerate dehydrogenase
MIAAMLPSIVILDAAPADDHLPGIWQQLEDLGSLTVHPRSTPAEIPERVAAAEAIIINKVPIDRALLAAAPKLRWVGLLATGYNQVDLAACRERGVAVANVPAYSTPSVAQWVFAALLQVFNDVAGHAAAVKDGAWARCPDFCFFFTTGIVELAGKTLVVVGMGDIGGKVAQIARGFDMQVIPAQVPGRPAAADRMPLEEALAQADVISLHCPLTERTAGMVDGAFLSACKRGAVLVNSGRGGLIDEAALAAALGDGRLRAACLDVLSAEPPPHGPILVEHPRTLVTPHIAWGSVESRRRLVGEVTANLRAFLAGERRNRVD